MKRVHWQTGQVTLLSAFMLTGFGCDDNNSDDGTVSDTGNFADDDTADSDRAPQARLVQSYGNDGCDVERIELSLCDWLKAYDVVALGTITSSGPVLSPMIRIEESAQVSDDATCADGVQNAAFALGATIHDVIGGRTSADTDASESIHLLVGAWQVDHWYPQPVVARSGDAYWRDDDGKLANDAVPYAVGTNVFFVGHRIDGRDGYYSAFHEPPGTVDSSGNVMLTKSEGCMILRPVELAAGKYSLEALREAAAACPQSSTENADRAYSRSRNYVNSSPESTYAATCAPDRPAPSACQTDLECPTLNTCRDGACVAM